MQSHTPMAVVLEVVKYFAANRRTICTRDCIKLTRHGSPTCAFSRVIKYFAQVWRKESAQVAKR